MSVNRKVFGLIGTLMCLSAFVVAMAGSLFICVAYTQTQGHKGHCGFEVASLRVSSLAYGILLVGIGFGGCALASAGGFSSRWWRFFRNVTVGLCAFTLLFTLFFQ
jgi:hypothetical protein